MRRGRGAPFGRSLEADRRACRPGLRCPARGTPARVAPARRVGEALRPGLGPRMRRPSFQTGPFRVAAGGPRAFVSLLGISFHSACGIARRCQRNPAGFLERVQVMPGDAREEVPKTGMNLASRVLLEPEGLARSLFDSLPHGEAPDRRLLEHLTGTGKGVNEYGQVEGGKVLLR